MGCRRGGSPLLLYGVPECRGGGSAYAIRTVNTVADAFRHTVCAAGNGNCCERDCQIRWSQTFHDRGSAFHQRVLEEDVQEELTVYAHYAHNCCYGCSISDGTQGDHD